MPDTKNDDGFSEKMRGWTPVGSYGSSVPIKKPVPADFQKWARRDFWHITEAVMLLLGFEPFNFKAPSWPKLEGFDDIYETASGRCIGEDPAISWHGRERRNIPYRKSSKRP
jgi:hypothetical protein